MKVLSFHTTSNKSLIKKKRTFILECVIIVTVVEKPFFHKKTF